MKTISKNTPRKALLLISAFFLSTFSFGQFCDSITPTMIVDLSASPNMSWTSPLIARDGNCCGTSNPDKCLEFVITLNPASIAVTFNIASGAIPPGALFYQIDCGPAIAVGSPICLTGPGPFHLTFCKPGNNANEFSITSYSEPIIGPDTTLSSGCTGMIYANYYNEPSMTWTSIFPGAVGAYDSYLDCTAGCDSVNVTAAANPPAYVDYLVCGSDIAGCNPLPYCDTIRVTFIPPVTVSVSPSAQHLCFGDPNTTVTATASSGTAPYFYSWNNGETTASISVGAGTYIVSVTDVFGCIVATDTAVITQDLLPILANAGPDQNMCSQSISPLALTGTIQTASGGIWSGGTGTFSPDDTTLNASYTPSALDITNGFVDLTLISTGNNGCPADTDIVRLNFYYFTETTNLTTVNVSCNGFSDGEAHITTNGMFIPCQYSWDSGALTTDTFYMNLTAGIHQVQIVNSLGCDTTLNFTITEPTVLTGAIINVVHNLCNSDLNGEAEATANGGTSPYSFSWNTVPVQNTALAQNLGAGLFTCTITDSNGCSILENVNITEPAPLTLVLAGVEPNCFGSTNGAISSLVGGGVGPYDYEWSNGAVSSNLYDLGTGWYTLEVTDDNNCIVTDSIFLNQPTQLTGSITSTTTICPGAPVEFGVSAAGGTGNFNYEWVPNGQTTDTITEFPIADGFYSCTVTDNNGCALLLTTNVLINILNPDDLQASIGDNAICFNDSVSLSAVYIGPDPTVTLSWVHCPTCATDVPIYETPGVNTEYVISATNSCGQTIYDTVSVIVNPLPIIALAPTMGTICPGGSVVFVNNGNNSPSWDYVWDFGDGTTSSSMNPEHVYESTGFYPISLTVTDDNGCMSNASGTSQVIVNPQAHAVFTTMSTVETTLDPTFELTNLSTNANIYSWNFGDGQSSSAVNPVHTYDTYGFYMVTLTANNMYNCPDSTFITLEVKPSFEIYVPNAFTPDGDDYNEVFFATGYGISDKDFTLYVFNRWGDLIFESHDMEYGWDGTIGKDGRKAQDDVYTWVVYYRDLTEKKHKKEGHVSLLK